jgi:hypothetical protein
MLALLAAAALAAGTPRPCPSLDPMGEVKERIQVQLGGKSYQAVSSSHPGEGLMRYSSSRLTLFTDDCVVAFDQDSQWPQVRASQARVGRDDVVVATRFEAGGSACTFDSLILTGPGPIHNVAPEYLGTDNMGGYHLGDLGPGKGVGLVVWQAVSDDGAHYSPHRYAVTTYPWKDGRLGKPVTTETDKKFEPAPDNVAKALGWSFRDDTHPERFGGC